MVPFLFEASKTSPKPKLGKVEEGERGRELRGGRSKLDTLALREKKERKKNKGGENTRKSDSWLFALYFLFCPKLFQWSSYRTVLLPLFLSPHRSMILADYFVFYIIEG